MPDVDRDLSHVEGIPDIYEKIQIMSLKMQPKMSVKMTVNLSFIYLVNYRR